MTIPFVWRASASPRRTELLDLGIPHYLLASTLNGVLAQRLVRTLCPHCKRPAAPPAESDWAFLLEPGEALPAVMQPQEPVGCLECRRTGYLGRVGLYELLQITPALRRLFHADMNLASFTAGARAEGGGWPPPLMSPAFGSSFTSLRGPPTTLGTRNGVRKWPINDGCTGSRRWRAPRSEVKEEAEGRGT